jgi:hypothetical protein
MWIFSARDALMTTQKQPPQPPSRPLFDVPNSVLQVDEDDSPERADAPRGSIFPSTIPTVQNRFFNQNSVLIDEGYDSEGGLPFFADEEVDDANEYFEEPLLDSAEGPTSAATSTVLAPADAGAAAVGLTVETMMSLNVAKLKEELRKRGRPIVGKKADLQARLREAILQNVPVAVGNEPPRHDSMMGLDVTAQWVLLTPEDEPICQPCNVDESLRPPTEMDAATNPKFAMKETFVRGVFIGTTEKMRYKGLHKSPTNSGRPPKKRARKGRKLSPTRKQVVNEPVGTRVRGGPNADFLKRYGLDERSHLMDWFSVLMPMNPAMNQEDPAAANVKGNKTTVFAVSNWTAYSNTKAIMCNTGEPGSIYAGKFKPFKNKDISSMLGVYIIDGLAPSPQLTWKMQDQERQPTHGNDRIAAVIGPVWQQKCRS